MSPKPVLPKGDSPLVSNFMDNDVLNVHIEGSLARVMMNRPEVHNAFDERLIAALTEAFESLSTDDAVRTIVLTGAGRSFCAGADLQWMGRMAGYSHEENLADVRTAHRLFATIYKCPKVTIARIQGAALGGGAGLAAVCDLAIAAESAAFAFSEVRLGVIPAVIAPYVLQKVPVGMARALFVTGERFSASEAHRMGLVQAVVPDETLDAAVEYARQMARESSPQAIAAIKQLLRDIAGKTPPEAAEATIAALAKVRVSEEGQEGIRAFLEKRKPGWRTDV